MTEISDLTADVFEPCVEETFNINGQPVTLKEVEKGEPHGPKMRAPFILTFTSEEPIGMQDGIQIVTHPVVGEVELLVHRVADPEGPTYEIIFG